MRFPVAEIDENFRLFLVRRSHVVSLDHINIRALGLHGVGCVVGTEAQHFCAWHLERDGHRAAASLAKELPHLHSMRWDIFYPVWLCVAVHAISSRVSSSKSEYWRGYLCV